MIISAIVLLFFSIVEGSIITIPICLSLLLVMMVVYKKYEVLIIGFLIGFILDSTSVRQLGSTSLYFLVFLGLVLLYQRKFEINSIYFVGLASFFGGLLYAIVFNYNFLVLQSIISVVIAILFYVILTKFKDTIALR